MNVSLDGFVETPDHGLDWTVIDEELHAWWGHQVGAMTASLYGRRVYEVMSAYWPTYESDPNATPAMLEFGRVWNAMPKIVFSTSLESVDFNSRLVAGDVGEELAKLRAEFDGDFDVAGPTLAAEFIKRGLVDEFRPVIHPVVLGGGTPFFPPLDRPIGLKLLETHVFGSGAVCQRYAATHD